MKITCATPEQFFEAVEQLVRRGLTFRANAENYSIELLGGY